MEQIIDDLSVNTVKASELSEKANTLLAETAPWIRFCALAGYATTAIGLYINSSGDHIRQIYNRFGITLPAGGSPTSPVFAFIAGAIGIVTATFLLLYSIKLTRYSNTRNADDLFDAFKNQRIYYTISGVLCIIYLAVIVLAVIVGVGVGLSLVRH